MVSNTLILQNAHDIMGITEEQVFVPLHKMKQMHMHKLQGGAQVQDRTTTSRKYTANVEKIQKIVHKIKQLYADLKAQLKKPFRTQGEESRAQRLVTSLSTKLTNAVAYFLNNLGKIKEMPAAVAKAMGQWWPFTQKQDLPSATPKAKPKPRRSARSRSSPERYVPS